MRLLFLFLSGTLAHAQPVATGDRTNAVLGLPATSGTYVVRNDLGPVKVTCSDSTRASGKVSWSIPGMAIELKTLTDQILPEVTKTASGATLTVKAPSLPTGAVVGLEVNVPAGGNFTVTGGNGAVEVGACSGTLNARNLKGDITVNGNFTALDLLSPEGNLSLTLGAGTLSVASTVAAPKGDITVQMPYFNTGVSATGDNITVQMPYLTATTQSATVVKGTTGKGGALLTLSGRNIRFR
jgi:DUF4097 and DUF4098 domain-containing protein YvlB